jgi:hypothetical protein
MESVMAEMAKGMAEALTDEEKTGKTQEDDRSLPTVEAFDFFDESKLKENAKHMGEGVTFLRGSKVISVITAWPVVFLSASLRHNPAV